MDTRTLWAFPVDAVHDIYEYVVLDENYDYFFVSRTGNNIDCISPMTRDEALALLTNNYEYLTTDGEKHLRTVCK